MPRAIRFHLDEHVAHAVADGLRRLGMDVTTTAGKAHAGVVYCHQGSRSIGQIIRALEPLWHVYEPDEMRNRVEFI